jgi:hypothetical protein
MEYLQFDGWARDNSSSLNMVFGPLEGLKNISSVNFLEIFDLDEHEDEGELQKFEYSEYIEFGTLKVDGFESQIFTFNGELDKLQEFWDRFNVDYVWQFAEGNFNLIHNNTIGGNLFSEVSENFNSLESNSCFWISRVVAF